MRNAIYPMDCLKNDLAAATPSSTSRNYQTSSSFDSSNIKEGTSSDNLDLTYSSYGSSVKSDSFLSEYFASVFGLAPSPPTVTIPLKD